MLISISVVTFAKGDKVAVKAGKDMWSTGEVTRASAASASYKVTLTSGDKVDVTTAKLKRLPAGCQMFAKAIPTIRLEKAIAVANNKAAKEKEAKTLVDKRASLDSGVVVPDLAQKKKNIQAKLTALGIDDATLLAKLMKLSYVISLKRATSTAVSAAGFFPFDAGKNPKQFLDGVKVDSKGFFSLMKHVGGGLKGAAGREHKMQKGYAPSRIDPKQYTEGTGEVTISGFEVPAGWRKHYTTKYKIPLNLYLNVIKGKTAGVYVAYINKTPVK